MTRSLAALKTRRGLLGGFAALGAGLLAGRGADAQTVTQAYCGNQTCKNNPGKCRDGCVCCNYGNGNSRCRPPGTCAPGVVLCPPGQVLGPSGVCATPVLCPPFTSPCGDACCPEITGVTCDENGCCQTRARDIRVSAQGSCTEEIPCCPGRPCQSGRCCEPEGNACVDPRANACCDGLVCSGGRCIAAT